MKIKRYLILIIISLFLFLNLSILYSRPLTTHDNHVIHDNHDIHANGELIFFQKDKVVLDTGEIFNADEKIKFFLNGYLVDSSKIKAGQIVYLQINPENYIVKKLEAYDNKIKPVARSKNLEIYLLKILNKTPLKKGDYLRVILKGTSQRQACFDVMGLTHNVPLKEVKTGVYEGRLKIKEGYNVKYGALVGFLKNRKEKVSNIVAGFSIAGSLPEIICISPLPESKSQLRRPDIFVVVKSKGTLINPSACKIYINNKEITHNTQKTVNLIFYKPSENLPYGKNYIKIKIVDLAGKVIYKEWHFEVAAP